jgi:dihydrofolate reductase
VEHCRVAHSLSDALALARSHGEEEVFVIGGGELYREALPLVTRMYLTFVDAVVPADTFFPAFAAGEWVEVTEQHFGASDNDQYATHYKVFERR